MIYMTSSGSKCKSTMSSTVHFPTISTASSPPRSSSTTLLTADRAAKLIHGFSKEALELFSTMRNLGVWPTNITFIGVLSACSHAGLVSEGRDFFHSMKDEYGIEPKIEHYGCMVDLLGRAGLLNETYELVKSMEMDPDPVLWGTLLAACKLHGNYDLGENITELLVQNGQANSGTYILLSNIYASMGNWDGVARTRTWMKDSGVQKKPGCSSIEVNNRVHEFLAGDIKHPKSKDIYVMLEVLNYDIKPSFSL